MQAELVTKSEFAAMIGVSQGRISQYITEGKLSSGELDGLGRSAKIKVSAALAALKIRLDASQMAGNGLGTKLGTNRPSHFLEAETSRGESDSLDVRFKQAKLQEQEARNRKVAEEEKVRAGLYMLADDAKSEMSKLASQILQSVDGGLSEIATAIAAKYKLPSRDVVHMVRSLFREQRQKFADRLIADGNELPHTLVDNEADMS